MNVDDRSAPVQARGFRHKGAPATKANVLLRVKEHLCQLLVSQHLFENHARVERNVLILVAVRTGECSHD